MCYWVLTANGDVIAETTVQHVTREEDNDPVIRPLIDAFDLAVKTRLDDSNFNLMPDTPGKPLADEDDIYLPLAETDDIYKQSDNAFVVEPEVYDKI